MMLFWLAFQWEQAKSRAILASMAPVPPFLLKTGDNLEGVDQSVFDGIMKAIIEDRLAYFSAFFREFFNMDVLLGDCISNEAIQASWNVAAGASAKGTLDCVPSWLTDFRNDLPRIDVPTLIVHGDADRILPLESTAARLPKLIKNSRLVVIPGGPHAINWTHANEVNSELLNFLQKRTKTKMSKKNKAILEEANAAIAQGNYEGFLSFCADDMKWTFVGDKTLQGKEAVRQWMATTYVDPPKFMVANLIAEGDFVTALGDITMKDADGKAAHYSYCDVWCFRGGKIVVRHQNRGQE